MLQNFSKFLIILFCVSFIHIQVVATSWIEKEEWLSPDINNFDCHTSCIIETEKGRYCAVWNGGPGQGKCNINMTENVGIWISLFDGNNWSKPMEIVSAPKSVCWTPVLCKNSLGELLLFYRIGPDPRRVVSFIKRSSNEGLDWSSEEILSAGIVGPTKNKPCITSSGRIISPSSTSVGNPEDLYKATACWLEISEDNGYHFKKIGPLELSHRKFGVVEPALFYDGEGKLRMVCRDRALRDKKKGYIWMAISDDEGLSWSQFKNTTIPNPDSGIDAVDLGNGKIILIYNHSHTDRFPLNLSISLDGGDNWSEPIVLDNKGEFPSGAYSSDGLVHITYATSVDQNEQRKIKHIVVNPVKLR